MYFRYMLIAFLTNGLGAFGLRILTGMGLAETYDLEYLALWYWSGCLIAWLVYVRSHGKPFSRELVVAGGMAVCSVLGQYGMVSAMSAGVPGFVVYPVAIAGGMLLVITVGVVSFRERLSRFGYLGTVVGFLALVLLAL